VSRAATASERQQRIRTTPMPSANEIRQQFVDFFVKKHGHTFVPSASVVPLDDPTLMFTNAGMNQFKDVFLGTGTRPYRRAANSQKCIRVSGKHNDLEEVGRDTYHHTFFEMLGNWSFGDYYKAEAIRWAWELLTHEWGIDKSRLHATVFGGDSNEGLDSDEEALRLWTSETDIDPAHVHRFGKKDNFWMMGETGPCGPCSEIHIDRTPDKTGGSLVNTGDPQVIEIWNLVFIQYNRDEKGKLSLLPAKHVDTGMGFERLTAVLQGKTSNYDTDAFSPIMAAIGQLTGKRYGGRLDDLTDIAFRVIADHLRMLTFAITDGALPSNKGRGSVIRSVLRRGVRFGWQYFGLRDPFIYKLVPVLVQHMGDAFPELKSNPGRIQQIIQSEETDFIKTVQRGIAHFTESALTAIARELARAKELTFESLMYDTLGADPSTWNNVRASFLDDKRRKIVQLIPPIPAEWTQFIKQHRLSSPVIPGKDVFELYTTHGFPPDLTRQMASEGSLAIDEEGFSDEMGRHEETSRGVWPQRRRVIRPPQVHPGLLAAGKTIRRRVPSPDLETAAAPSPSDQAAGIKTNDRLKWETASASGRIIGWVEGDEITVAGEMPKGRQVELLLDQTCFYAESGGQVGDKGKITTDTGVFRVSGTNKVGDLILHVGSISEGRLEAGQSADLLVDADRDLTRKNHTATHLLHFALRKVLGEHVEQRGSKVKPDEFTFDFSHSKPMSEEEKQQVERFVNERVYQDLPVQWRELPIKEAQQLPGVRAFFGDKYGDVVRVVEIGDGFSREFCGGTHLDHTGQIGYFKIVGEEGIAKGVRRLTCVTGPGAVAAVQREDSIVADLTGRFRCKPEDLPARVEALQDEVKKLQQQLRKGAATDLQGVADKLLAESATVQGARIVVGEMPAGPEEQMRQQVDRLRQKAASAVVVLGWAEDSKVQLIAAVTDDLVKRGLHAGKLVGQVARVVGGGGGGKPTLAQAGGKEPAKLPEALALARKLALEQLGQ
jgi:alanyl-tRNA synthetase